MATVGALVGVDTILVSGFAAHVRSVVTGLEWLEKLSPFTYYGSPPPLNSGNVDPT